MSQHPLPLQLRAARHREEVRAAALQYVRKISGFTKPSQANAEAFERAVDAVAEVSGRLLGELVTAAPPKDREVEAAKANGPGGRALRGLAGREAELSCGSYLWTWSSALRSALGDLPGLVQVAQMSFT